MQLLPVFNKHVHRMLACTGLPRIPAGTLTNQHKQVTLPLYLPELLVVEPWVESDPVKVTAAPGGKVEVQWEGSSRWVEVNIGLIGELVSLRGCPRGAGGGRDCCTAAGSLEWQTGIFCWCCLGLH